MTRLKRNHATRGVSLLEVIACTALVTILIVPIAGVIRASGKSIQAANGPSSTESELRQASRWLAQTIRANNILGIRRSQMQLRLDSGETATLRLKQRSLILDAPSGPSTLAKDIQRIRFTSHRQAAPPRKTVGVTFLLQKRDHVTRRMVSIEDTVSFPTQY